MTNKLYKAARVSVVESMPTGSAIMGLTKAGLQQLIQELIPTSTVRVQVREARQVVVEIRFSTPPCKAYEKEVAQCYDRLKVVMPIGVRCCIVCVYDLSGLSKEGQALAALTGRDRVTIENIVGVRSCS